jgi:hypothetical protein
VELEWLEWLEWMEWMEAGVLYRAFSLAAENIAHLTTFNLTLLIDA